ncbi:MAG: ferredoxin--NADP reductase [Planctomycetota bacterium]
MSEPGARRADGDGAVAEDLLNATVTAYESICEGLFVITVRPDGERPAFVAGQFTNLGLPPRAPEFTPNKGGLVKRAYSIASAPSDEGFEFYVRVVDEGALTPALAQLRPGDRIWCDTRCLGKFTLDNLPDDPPAERRDLVLVATGTGFAPYRAMLREYGPARARGEGLWNRLVIVKGVRLAEDLGYLEEMRALEREHDWFRFVPMCTREPEGSGYDGLRGRVPTVLEPARFREVAGFDIAPETSQVFLCGNPAMIDQVEAELEGRGFKRHRAKEPGQIHLERYW